ncbi:MAG: 4Fe-4S dicluster domain-containing protein [Coriobacteriia bacterium]|nr:4Fe-4S dicluster domain-containing protein [Coriobacteriia bacterium]
MDTIDLSASRAKNRQAIEAVAKEARVDLKDCYQCGKCSAGCPVSHAMDLMPRELIRLMQLNSWEEVLEAKTPWLCASCVTCVTRCPQDVDLPSLMEEVRRASKAAGKRPIKEPDIFDDLFIKGIYQNGRSNELYLMMKYNLTSGHPMQDALNAPHLLLKGMVGFKVHKVKDREDVRRIIDKCLGGEGS